MPIERSRLLVGEVHERMVVGQSAGRKSGRARPAGQSARARAGSRCCRGGDRGPGGMCSSRATWLCSIRRRRRTLVATKIVRRIRHESRRQGKSFQVRRLRNYAQIFREATRRRTELTAQTAEVTGQAEHMPRTAANRSGRRHRRDRKGTRRSEEKPLPNSKPNGKPSPRLSPPSRSKTRHCGPSYRKPSGRTSKWRPSSIKLNHRLQEEINRRNPPPVQSQASLATPAAR